MKLLNRAGLSVQADTPFLEWCRTLPEALRPPEESLQALQCEGTVYLIPEVEAEADFQRILQAGYARIFENELEAWCEEPDYWPDTRSFETFQRWFRVTPQVMAFDLADEPLLVANYQE